MEDQKLCQVLNCHWPVVLCPELCAPHWWFLPKDTRQTILRAQMAGLKNGSNPTSTYVHLMEAAIRYLNVAALNDVLYIREPGDVDTRHSRLTWCSKCASQQPHHSFIRDGEPGLYCSRCLKMIQAIPSGAHTLPGMEPTP